MFVTVIAAKPEDHEKFAEFTQAHGFKATLLDCVLPAPLSGFSFRRFSQASLLRLKLDEILPENYARVLYLDSDILAMGPIAEVFNADLKGKSVGAVEDYVSLPRRIGLFASHSEKIGMSKSAPYFNSGVMLFDWAKTRQNGHLCRAVGRIVDAMQQGRKFSLPDQDVLNLEFAGDWQRLNLRFNMMAFFVDYFPGVPLLRHFSNRQKPWGPLWQPGFRQARAMYRETFANSPWPSFAPGPYTGLSLVGTFGFILRKLDPFSAPRYRKHMERP